MFELRVELGNEGAWDGGWIEKPPYRGALVGVLAEAERITGLQGETRLDRSDGREVVVFCLAELQEAGENVSGLSSVQRLGWQKEGQRSLLDAFWRIFGQEIDNNISQ